MNGGPIARAWRDSVLDAVVRLSSRYGTQTIQRQALLTEELDRIVEEARSEGATRAQTLSRVLQNLRDEGVLEFLGGGAYRVTKHPVDVEVADLTDPEIDAAIRQRLLRLGRVETGTTVAEARRRRGQARLRVLVLQNYGSRCAVCDVRDPYLLVASHIVPWAEAPDARGDLGNLICLCRFHDALFENGYWSLKEDLSLLRRSPLASQTLQLLLPEAMSFVHPIGRRPESSYLQLHRGRQGFEV